MRFPLKKVFKWGLKGLFFIAISLAAMIPINFFWGLMQSWEIIGFVLAIPALAAIVVAMGFVLGWVNRLLK